MTSPSAITTEPAKEIKTINRKLNPTRIFVDRNRLALFWFVIATIAILIAIVQPLYLVERFKQRERVIIIDPAGTYFVSPVLDFEEAKELHAAQGALAAKSLLNCSPVGFDSPKILSQMYLPKAARKAKHFWEAQQKEFESKQIHQKVEVSQLNILETRENFTLVEVRGQLIRTGVFQGKTFVESPQFRVVFKMIRNPDMTKNNRFPTAVTDFRYENIQN